MLISDYWMTKGQSQSPLPKLVVRTPPFPKITPFQSNLRLYYVLTMMSSLLLCVLCVHVFYMMSVGVLLPARYHASAGISRHRVSVCV